MKEWVPVLNAIDTAARWHVDQRRKSIVQEPYINHLIEVASLVAQATDQPDPTVVIAAVLHDAVEDQGVTANTISAMFGDRVAALVMEVTDDKTLPKAVRKQLQVETAPKKSQNAKLIKLADKTSNVRAVLNSPAANWSVERRREYVEWATRVVAGLRGTSALLERQFDDAAELALRSLDESRSESRNAQFGVSRQS